MKSIRTLKLFLLVLVACSCSSYDKVPLTGCEHKSGWCDEIRSLAVASWKYSQLANNVYDKPYHFSLNKQYASIQKFENLKLDFYAELFQNRKTKEYVLVFRGTDSIKDFWTGNNPFSQAQNKYGLHVFDDVIKNFHAEKYIVVGHSLGGGIATHISLNRGNVTSYVFNTSSVFKKSSDFQNERYSIVEKGEILKLIRMPSSEPNQLYTSISCSKGNSIKQHDMQKLSTCLTQIAAIDDPEARESLKDNNILFVYR